MRAWNEAKIEELSFASTQNNGNNDTHEHKGWCEMHKHPENGICTCGLVVNNPS